MNILTQITFSSTFYAILSYYILLIAAELRGIKPEEIKYKYLLCIRNIKRIKKLLIKLLPRK
ncbi:MAG: hypothetical protein DRH33_02695 [Candidatus Nealsonbacteria bacterium]|nr:MAG: hypothetical protein DRH33_02695 [Candidatus Nealsonbacteria bacterium]